MKKKIEISFYNHCQPSTSCWQSINKFMKEWNINNKPKFKLIFGFWTILFEEKDQYKHQEFLDRIIELQKSYDVVYNSVIHKEYDEDDFLNADFLNFCGVALNETERNQLISNIKDIFTTEKGCSQCGESLSRYREQTGDLIINEELCNGEAWKKEELEQSPKAGWDIVNIDQGGVIVSKKFVDILRQENAQGYEVRDVISLQTGQISKKYYQLMASQAVLVPCLEHTLFEGGTVCPGCGISLGSPRSEFFYENTKVEDLDFFSDDRRRTASIYISQRIYRALKDNKVEGLYVFNPVYICQH